MVRACEPSVISKVPRIALATGPAARFQPISSCPSRSRTLSPMLSFEGATEKYRDPASASAATTINAATAANHFLAEPAFFEPARSKSSSGTAGSDRGAVSPNRVVMVEEAGEEFGE